MSIFIKQKDLGVAVKIIIIIFGLALNFNILADKQDGVAVLGDNATEVQMQAVREGAKTRCEEIDDENKREVCVVDYFAQHNLEEEPSCD